MDGSIPAPMPGLVASVKVGVGDRIAKGQEVIVLNCMKTELEIASHLDGVVTEVLVEEWDEVDIGAPLVKIECAKADVT